MLFVLHLRRYITHTQKCGNSGKYFCRRVEQLLKLDLDKCTILMRKSSLMLRAHLIYRTHESSLGD